jgi:hypothetical protein
MPAGHLGPLGCRDVRRATRPWKLAGKNRSSRAISTRVGTAGQLSMVQGDAKTVSDWRGSPCAQASSITGFGSRE